MSLGAVDRRRLRGGFGREEILDLLAAGMAGVDPGRLVRFALEGDVGACDMAQRRVVVLSIGKASIRMADAAVESLGEAVAGGIVVAPAGAGQLQQRSAHRLELYPGGHPVPDEGSVAAAKAIERLVGCLAPADVAVCLLSGGGSALVAAPIDGLALADLQRTFELLLASGVPIGEANTVRRHLARLSGGRLARLIPGRVETLALSDVPGNRPEAIASGPTVPDPTTFRDAREALRRFDLWAKVPYAVRREIERGSRGEIEETVKPGDPALARARFAVIGCGGTFVDAAASRAAGKGWGVVRAAEPLEGEARYVGERIGRELRSLAETATAPTAWLAAGETTVVVRGSGLGGRNQEAALAAGRELAGVANAALAFFATDGVDGPTDAAGAVADGETVRRARATGRNERAALEGNDSHSILRASGDLLATGPTGTNVADVAIGFVAPRELSRVH
jgi:glycerate 2-kinase